MKIRTGFVSNSSSSSFIIAGNVTDIATHMLETVYSEGKRGVKKALKKAGAEGILVSGSGSAVYGIFSERREAIRAEGKLAKRGNWQLFLTRSY